MQNQLELLRSAVELLPVAAAVTDSNGTIIHANQPCTKILSDTNEGLKGDQLRIEKKTHGEYTINLFSRVEPSSEKSTKDLNELFEKSPIAIVSLSFSGSILKMNESCRSLFGREGGNIRNFISPESEIIFRSEVDKLRKGQGMDAEIVVKKREGERRFTHFYGIPGDVGFTAFIRDETAMRNAEESLEITRRNMETFLENARDYVVFQLTDIEMGKLPRVVFVSPSIVELGGIKESESTDIRAWLRGVSDNKDVIAKFRDIYSPPYSVSFHFNYNHPKKGERWLHIAISGIPEGNGLKSVNGFIHDVTALMEARKRLKQSEEKFRLMARNVSDIIWTCDKNFRFTWVSPSVKATLGYSPEDFTGISIENAFDKRSIEELQEKLNLVYLENFTKHTEESRGSFNLRISVRHRLGHYVDTDTGFTVIHDERDNFAGLIGATRDITATLEYERKLWSMNNSLEETNKKLVQTQNTMIRQEKMASIGQLSAGIAHEINNPLGFVSSNFSTLKRYLKNIADFCDSSCALIGELSIEECGKDCPLIPQIKTLKKKNRIDFIMEDIVDIMEESGQGIERMRDIVQNLKSFSHQGQAEDFRPVVIDDIVRNALTLGRNEIKYVADVKKHLDAKESFMANGGELGQVILNLLVNAAHAIADQNRQDRGQIDITTRIEGEQVLLSVADDGPGIPREHINHIFDPFYTTKEPGRGTGLGLYISYDIIVNKHNGQIRVERSPKGGTSFEISLPFLTEAGYRGKDIDDSP